MLQTFLQEQGLSPNEAKLYIAAYKLGSSPISVLAKHSDLNRTTAYGNVKNLVKRGLLTKHSRAHIEYFAATTPKVFEKYLEERKHRILEQQQEIKKILSLFENIKSPYIIKPKVQFYEGIEGVKQIHELMIQEKKTIYSFLPIDLVPKKLLKYVKNDFMKAKRTQKIFSHIIAPSGEETISLKKRDNKENRETYLISPEKFPFESEITIFGDYVAMIGFESPDIIGVLIQSPSIARTMRLIFELCAQESLAQKVS